jgi:hypothetical protein
MAATLELTAKEDVTEKLFKLEQQNLRLIEQNKRLAQESGSATRAAKAGFDGLANSISGMIPSATQLIGALGGITSVVGVVASLKAGYAEWREEIGRLAEKHTEFVNSFIRDMARSRDAAAAPRISAWLKTIPGVIPDEARQIFAGTTAAGPTVDLERRQKLTAAAASAVPLEEGRLEEWGTLVGKVGRMAPGRTAEATAGLALKLQQLAGQHVDQLTGDKFMRAVSTLKKAGIPEEEAMAQMLVGLEQGQGRPGALISAAAAIDKEMKVIKPTRGHRVLTDKEKAENRFAQAGRAERLRLLQSDKGIREAILGDQAIMYAQVDAKTVASRTGELRAAESGGYLADQVAAIQKSSEGMEGKIAREQKLETYSNQAGDREIGTRLERAELRFQAYQAGKPWYDRWANRSQWWFAGWENPERTYADWFPGQGGREMARKADRQEREIRQTKGLPEPPGYESQTVHEARQIVPYWDLLGKDDQMRILQQIERNTRGPHPAAVQQNVTQHGEGK